MNARRAALGLVTLAALGSPAAGQLHQSDIVVRFEQGRIQTGAVDPATGLPRFPQRVFGSAFASNGFINDPGIDSAPGLLSTGQQIGFDLLGGLRRWNGTDFSEFSATPIRVRFGGFTVFTPLSAVDQSGFALSGSSVGQFHRHYGFTLCADPPTCATAPTQPGIFLATFRLWTTAPGIQPADPHLIVFNWNADPAQYEAAVAFAQTLVSGTPCGLDFNQDGFLNQEDLGGYLTAFLDESVPAGPSGTSAAPCPGEPSPYDVLGYAADFNRDCAMNQEDLGGFITEYFTEVESPSACVPG